MFIHTLSSHASGRTRALRAVSKTALLVFASLLFAATPVFAQQVLATTPWTAAFAELAGADDVDLLAPYEMRHPPEYELRATDLQRIDDADLLVYAGYENMMDRLRDAIGSGATEAVQISTTHTGAAIEEAAMKIAEAIGTVGQARENLERMELFFDEWRAELRELGLHERPVIVHSHQRALFEDLGVEIGGVFGPGPLEAQQIGRLSGSEAVVIIDNWHNEIGQPFAETMPGIPAVSFINFPGREGTRTLSDVLELNRQELRSALE